MCCEHPYAMKFNRVLAAPRGDSTPAGLHCCARASSPIATLILNRCRFHNNVVDLAPTMVEGAHPRTVTRRLDHSCALELPSMRW